MKIKLVNKLLVLFLLVAMVPLVIVGLVAYQRATTAIRDLTYNNLGAALDFSNGIGTVDSYKSSAKLIAFFGRVNLNINSIWFLTASARYEGSSRFGTENKWGLFPAIGGGVELANFLAPNITIFLITLSNIALVNTFATTDITAEPNKPTKLPII